MSGRKFWVARLVFIGLQLPLIIWLKIEHPAWLLDYLVYMSWATWVSSELPTKEK